MRNPLASLWKAIFLLCHPDDLRSLRLSYDLKTAGSASLLSKLDRGDIIHLIITTPVGGGLITYQEHMRCNVQKIDGAPSD